MKEIDMAKIVYAQIINAICECENMFEGDAVISFPSEIEINGNIYAFRRIDLSEDKQT